MSTSISVSFFLSLFLLNAHREASTLAGELPEESEQFRFLRASFD
jgi:hypothetical protein